MYILLWEKGKPSLLVSLQSWGLYYDSDVHFEILHIENSQPSIIGNSQSKQMFTQKTTCEIIILISL